MKKLFEVPYNFSRSLVNFYKKYINCINFIYLPPYKDDSINTRTSIETKKKGHCYMPQTRSEYESHLKYISQSGIKYVVLWQDRENFITKKTLDYYSSLGASGFIIANDINAKIIKEYDPDLIVVASLVQRLCNNISKRDFRYYDYLVLYYSFNRSLEALKTLSTIKDKIVLMPNTLCHIDCPSIQHWFPTKERPFIQGRDCMILKDKGKYLDRCGFISPKHLYMFDEYVAGYKLQGREYSTDLIEYICQIYFERKSSKELLSAMLGKDLSVKFQEYCNRMTLENYYNVKTPEIIDTI